MACLTFLQGKRGTRWGSCIDVDHERWMFCCTWGRRPGPPTPGSLASPPANPAEWCGTWCWASSPTTGCTGWTTAPWRRSPPAMSPMTCANAATTWSGGSPGTQAHLCPLDPGPAVPAQPAHPGPTPSTRPGGVGNTLAEKFDQWAGQYKREGRQE